MAARRPPSKKPASRQGASPRRQSAATQSRGLPGWLWGIIGLIAGFALAQYFEKQAPRLPVAAIVPKVNTQQNGQNGNKSASDKQGSAKEDASGAMPTFEFYTLLPETEVIAPKVDAYKSTPRPGSSESTKASTAALTNYMLQAASFREMSDAKKLAGKLKDLGLLAKVSDVNASGGTVWHRVQVGPYKDTRELNRAQDLMNTQGIEPLLIKLQ
ncbi:SPOR domain-containing protein [Cobetia sp. L2A1]|uniref:SPOR domain-containing protein n=1 Tax=Cobetia sp. L2A1 TaxID=2686360 RepID=UPI00131DE5EE|nr:SPOR domain-containing protein [Cobetia sp. L2A1]